MGASTIGPVDVSGLPINSRPMQQDLGGFVLPPAGTDDLESQARQSRAVLGQALQNQQSQLAAQNAYIQSTQQGVQDPSAGLNALGQLIQQKQQEYQANQP